MITWNLKFLDIQRYSRILILPWETFWIVLVGIKRFVKRLKISVVK